MKKKFLGMVNHFRPESFILMYHKVTESQEIDPWRLGVSANNFDNQLAYLKKHYNVISLEKLVANKKKNRLEGKSVALTFDDGYSDNYTTAYPILKKHNLPATFFVNSGYIENQKEFWPDKLIRLLLHEDPLPKTALELKPINKSWDISKGHYAHKPRMDFFMDVWYSLLQVHPLVREQLLNEIELWSKPLKEVTPGSHAMTERELIQLSEDPLISIGCHTANHAALRFLDIGSQREEIGENKYWLEDVLRKPITGFAYPNGEYNSQTLSLMKEFGFEYACTTEELRNSYYLSNFKFPRHQVCDWNQSEFITRLQQW